ncbi:MAG: hypothetical protein Q8N44_00220 [Rubrivivax sp.]|nr:hypothetical protein [Rubrivivax sp.]
MFNTFSHRATALGLATLATLIMLGGVDHLASPAAETATTLAAAHAPVDNQVVVITGHRAPQI